MRYLIAAAAIALLAIRAVLPALRLDEWSVVLFAIASLALLIPDLQRLTLWVRRLRFGGFEVEVAQEVTALGERAERTAEKMARADRSGSKVEDLAPDVAQRIAEAAADPRSALLLVAIEVEHAIRRLIKQHNLPYSASPTEMLSALEDENLVAPEVVELFRDFWAMRNRILHAAGFQVPAGQIYQLVDVGLTILRLLGTGEVAPAAAPPASAGET